MDSELRRLRKIIVRMGLLLILILIAVVAYFSSQLQEMRSTLYTASINEQMPIKGLDGKDGKDGLSVIGPQGEPGKNAVSTVTTTIIEKPTILQQNIPVPGPPGQKGDKGEPGKAAKEIELATRDGDLVFRYTGDTIWQLIEEVQ